MLAPRFRGKAGHPRTRALCERAPRGVRRARRAPRYPGEHSAWWSLVDGGGAVAGKDGRRQLEVRDQGCGMARHVPARPPLRHRGPPRLAAFFAPDTGALSSAFPLTRVAAPSNSASVSSPPLQVARPIRRRRGHTPPFRAGCRPGVWRLPRASRRAAGRPDPRWPRSARRIRGPRRCFDGVQRHGARGGAPALAAGLRYARVAIAFADGSPPYPREVAQAPRTAGRSRIVDEASHGYIPRGHRRPANPHDVARNAAGASPGPVAPVRRALDGELHTAACRRGRPFPQRLQETGVARVRARSD